MFHRGKKLVMLACPKTPDKSIEDEECPLATENNVQADNVSALLPPVHQTSLSIEDIGDDTSNITTANVNQDTNDCTLSPPISKFLLNKNDIHDEPPLRTENVDQDINASALSSPISPSLLNRDIIDEENPPEQVEDPHTGDFSGTDSGDEFIPMRSLSSSSSSSTSSSSSSTSSSSSSSASSSSSSSVHNNTEEEFGTSTCQELHETPKKRGRKRTRNPNKWKKNVAKKLKNTGKEYRSIKTGKVVEARKMGPPCTDKCRLSCSSRFSTEKRNEIFDSYWKLGSVERQRDFLNACSRPLEVVSRRIKTNNTRPNPRQGNTAFYFFHGNQEFRVCKTFLINTLGISQRTIRTVIDGKKLNNGFVPEDRRGKHGKQNKLDSVVIQAIKDHIDSIPKVESHYLRANTSREYFDGGLTIAELYRNYSEVQKQNNKPIVKYDAYARIFNHDFNIGFFKPKKDLCDECVAYENASEEEKNKLRDSYKLHQEEKSLSRIEKEKDMKECQLPQSTKIVMTFDLQAVLPCPVGNSSAFFYKSRLNCYNFTISNAKEKETTCYFWHEGLGNRGAIEIGSCVYLYLQEVAIKNPGCDLIFYSDNASGQNKNRFIFAMYYYAVTTLNINSIQHNYLIRGHTQNEGDAAHSVIEKAITRAKKSGPLYIPEQYISIIRGAKKTGKPFVVKEMNYDNFFDLKVLADNINFNTTKNIKGDVIKVTEIKHIKFTKNSSNYQYRTTYKTENWEDVKAVIEQPKKNLRGRTYASSNEITLKPAYTSNIPITERKKRDLLQLVATNIVPRYYEKFFKDLI